MTVSKSMQFQPRLKETRFCRMTMHPCRKVSIRLKTFKLIPIINSSRISMTKIITATSLLSTITSSYSRPTSGTMEIAEFKLPHSIEAALSRYKAVYKIRFNRAGCTNKMLSECPMRHCTLTRSSVIFSAVLASKVTASLK